MNRKSINRRLRKAGFTVSRAPGDWTYTAIVPGGMNREAVEQKYHSAAWDCGLAVLEDRVNGGSSVRLQAVDWA